MSNPTTICYAKVKDYLMESILSDKSLQETTFQLAKNLGYPILFIDKNFQVLFHSCLDDIHDSYWIKSIQQGFCSFEFISTIQKLEAFQKGKEQDAFFEVVCPIDSSTKWVKPITLTPNLYGYLVILNKNSSLSEDELSILGFFSQFILKEGKKHFLAGYQSPYDGLLQSFLDESHLHKSDDPVFLRQMKRVQAPYRLMLLSLLSYNFTLDSPTMLRQRLLTTFPSARILLYQESIVILLDKQEEKITFPSSFLSYLENHNLQLILSKKFDSLEDIKSQYNNLVHTEQISRQNPIPEHNTATADDSFSSAILPFVNPRYPTILFDEEYSLYHLFNRLEKNGQIQDYLLPEIIALALYDKHSENHYLATLETFLRCNQNRIETANALFIHRNTLQYRLDKMSQKFHIPWQQPSFTLPALFTLSYLGYKSRRDSGFSIESLSKQPN